MEFFSRNFARPTQSSKHKALRLVASIILPFFMGTFVVCKVYSIEIEASQTQSNTSTPKSIIFYYNTVDSITDLINFDRIVLEPSLVTDRQIHNIHKADSLVFAYLSVGELSEINVPTELTHAVLLTNVNWQSKVMDLSSLAWQKHLHDQAKTLIARGFDGIFLDTLDSYELVIADTPDDAKQKNALLDIINQIQSVDTSLKLILNRGFDIVNELHSKPYAVLAESMHHSYSPSSQSYEPVRQADTDWLMNKLDIIKKLHIEPVVVDYLPPTDQAAQINAARHLLAQGYTPYISDGMLYEVGVSTVVPIAKRVLGFYNGKRQQMVESECHRMLSMPIEYLGYIPDCQDIHKFNFQNVSLNKYAAITFWLDSNDYTSVPQLNKLIANAYEKLPILILGAFPSSPITQKLLGVTLSSAMNLPLQQVQGHSWTANFRQAHFSLFDSANKWVPTKAAIKQEVVFKDDNSQETTYVFSSSWGGAALAPFPIKLLPNQKVAWMLDPFKLLSEILKLPAIPVPDITTESGRRILISYVDGDGFPSKSTFPGKPYTAEVLRDKIFTQFKVPHTISVIQGEIYPGGLYPKQSEALQNIARSIYKIPNVELASHTYSHPFFWRETDISEKLYGDHLPIKGYEIDYNKEILGSIDYINTTLAPEGKKANLILWSGAANPSEEILQIAERNNILNINGGNTFIVEGDHDLTQVSPHIVSHSSAVQVYAPIINENLYTNLWTEHYDGFAKVIETFSLLESPRRLKPISIYYHMYSGQFPASVKALVNVYDWVMSQSLNPMYLSEYASRARALYDTGIAKTLNGHWQVSSTGIKSIRLPHELGYPDTKHVIGYSHATDGKFIPIGNAKTVFGTLKAPRDNSFLISSNGQVIDWQSSRSQISWTISTHVPLEIDVQLATDLSVQSCQVKANKTISLKNVKSNRLKIISEHIGTITGSIECKTIVEQGLQSSL